MVSGKDMLKNFIKKEYALALLFVVIWNELCYNIPRLFTGNLHHYNMELPIEQKIPFLPWTVFIYFVCFLFWGVNYVLACKQESRVVWQFLFSDVLAKTVCLLFFVFLPTTNIRPEVGDRTIWDWIMKLLYRMDAADNLFPSIHCLVSWLSYVGVRKNPVVPKWYRIFSFVFAWMVCLSTLTTKQHVLADVIGGVLLGEISYIVSGKLTAWKFGENKV